MRDLILVLADSKRLLGTRYAEWILGAPELEAGIACASMAQDEWGHGRLLYALLKDFGDDTDRIEHGREAAEYRNIEALDAAPTSWPELIVLNALVDTALTVQLEALREAEHAPLRQRVAKLLDEETFHAQHGSAWLKRLATASSEAKSEVTAATRKALPVILRWFGPGADGDALRSTFLQRVQPLLEATGEHAPQPDFKDFDVSTRRTANTSPDADTIRRVRGDKNRIYLMD
jgi:ring-1,2-phenylacetyl-CoA epoxidase subunit PaaC